MGAVEKTNEAGETVKDLEFDNKEEKVADVSTERGESEQDYLKEHRYTEQDMAMERSNAKRARDESVSIQAAYEQSLSEIESLKQQMNEVKEEKKTLEDMDTDLVDGKVIANIRALEAKMDKIEKRNAQLEAKAQGYEKVEAERQREAEKAATREKILKPLDEEFGANLRNKAIKMAEDLIDQGKEIQPSDAIDAAMLMRKCYKELAEKKKSSVASDNGSAPGGGAKGSGIKPGSRQEVLEQMQKDSSWKT